MGGDAKGVVRGGMKEKSWEGPLGRDGEKRDEREVGRLEGGMLFSLLKSAYSAFSKYLIFTIFKIF
jgi:hypothetical protein